MCLYEWSDLNTGFSIISYSSDFVGYILVYHIFKTWLYIWLIVIFNMNIKIQFNLRYELIFIITIEDKWQESIFKKGEKEITLSKYIPIR